MYIKQNNGICPYHHYYSHQGGTGIGVIYKGVPHQRGHGIGSFLGGLFRSVLPLLSNGAKVVGNEMLNAGKGLLSDFIHAQPMRESFENRFKEVTSNLKRKADDKITRVMSGSGYKNKKRNIKALIHSQNLKGRAVKRVKKNKNLTVNDIFS